MENNIVRDSRGRFPEVRSFLSEEFKSNICDNYLDNNTLENISKTSGLSTTLICSILKERNIRRRPAGFQRNHKEFRIIKAKIIKAEKDKNPWNKRKDIEKRKEEIFELYEQDYSIKKIADLMGCDFGVIKRILLQNNKTLKYARLAGHHKEIVEMYINNNISSKKIADIFGCCSERILDILHMNNVLMKGPTYFNKKEIRVYKNKRMDLWSIKESIKEDYSKTQSIYQLSKKYKCSTNILTRILKSMDVKIIKEDNINRRRADVWPNQKSILDAYANGAPVSSIAKSFKCDYGVIRNILKKNNIKIRSGHSYMTELKKQQFINRMKPIREIMVFPKKDTKIEIKIQNYLQQLGYEFFTHRYMKEIEHGYQCDILIPAMNLVIECDRDYWHAYPTGRDIDHIRTKELLEKGFKVLRLWECEIKKLSLEQFKEKLI